jgi:hypothetical protein
VRQNSKIEVGIRQADRFADLSLRAKNWNVSETERTVDFNAGDVGYVPQTLGHSIENTGDTDLVFLEMFKSPRYQELSLNDWPTHLPPECWWPSISAFQARRSRPFPAPTSGSCRPECCRHRARRFSVRLTSRA